MTLKNENETRLRVLITAPSLDVKQNVSGISTMVRNIIEHGNSDTFHFAAGRSDRNVSYLVWLLNQFILPLRFAIALFTKRIDVVHINTAFEPLSIYRDTVLTTIAKFFGYPVLLHLHGGSYLKTEFESAILRWIAGEMLHTADRVVVLSEWERSSLLRRWKRLSIEILPNAVDCDEISFAAKPDRLENIVFLGRIDRNKGLGEIVEATRMLEADGFGFRFDCYGAGPQADSFASEMNEVLGDRFTYRGVVAGPAKWEALTTADIFLLPSYFEGLPLSILEAMAAKCVVVATDVGSIKTVIKSSHNGFLVEPHDAVQIADTLRLLLSDKTDWASLRDNARKTIETGYSIKSYSTRLLRIYEGIGE